MHAISIKELREKMPLVRSELKKGTSFLIICKSKPIAQLTPIPNGDFQQEISDEDKAWEAAGIEDCNKALGDDYLTEEEVKYYLSLKQKDPNGIR